MIDFTYFWPFIVIFVFAIPLSIAIVINYALLANIKDSVIWSSMGLIGSIIIGLEFEIAKSIAQSVTELNSPMFFSAFIGILGGILGLGFNSVSASVVRRTSGENFENAAIRK